MQFSYHKTANRTAPCGVVRCDALLLMVRCGYAILQVVLVRFLRFGEHPDHVMLNIKPNQNKIKYLLNSKRPNNWHITW